MRFFDDFATAKAAGFRACKRCAPADVSAHAERQRLIARACEFIDADDAVTLDAVAKAVSLSRFHFQRMFRAVVGITPGEYRRARRAERLRAGLSERRSVTAAIQAAGYGSSSRAYEARALGMTPSSFRDGARGERIAYALATCSLGRVLVARTQRGICAIELADDDAGAIASVRRRFPHASFEPDAKLDDNLSAAVAFIDRAEGSHETLGLDVRGTAFQRAVWNALRDIPAGERRSYSELAAAVGRPRAARAVAAACAQNRLAVVIPCHRAVGADGELRGYRWGTQRKAQLLRREAANAAASE